MAIKYVTSFLIDNDKLINGIDNEETLGDKDGDVKGNKFDYIDDNNKEDDNSEELGHELNGAKWLDRGKNFGHIDGHKDDKNLRR